MGWRFPNCLRGLRKGLSLALVILCYPAYLMYLKGMKIGADEKNRTSTASRPQASETCASTSSATSADPQRRNIDNTRLGPQNSRNSSCDLLYLKQMVTSLHENLADVRRRIETAAKRCGRNADEIKLVAISKTHPAEILRGAIAEGVTAFGENRIQEAEGKIEQVGSDAAEWHLVGHLQSNKARRAVQLFDVIQSLDSVDLAKRLERVCIQEARSELPVYIEVDLAGEESKTGIAEDKLDELVRMIRCCIALRLEGLMVVPPYFDDAEKVRPYFRRLRETRDRLLADGAFADAKGELSMGMSNDFEVAIEEGATVIRIGTAIFGERESDI